MSSFPEGQLSASDRKDRQLLCHDKVIALMLSLSLPQIRFESLLPHADPLQEIHLLWAKSLWRQVATRLVRE
jgi:hypothetical protein